MIKTGIILLFLIFSYSGYSNTDSLFQSANLHYSNNEFDLAIEKYEQIIAKGYESCELYFNLGNAYYKTRNIGKAIVNYERAKLLNPKNEDILFNLELANSLIVDKIDEIPTFPLRVWISNIIQFYPSDTWAIISILSFIVLLISLLLYLFAKTVLLKKVSFWLGILLFIVTILSFNFSYQHKKILTKRDYAIVLSPSLTAKSTPDINGSDLFVIHEGLKVKIEDTLGDWCEIKLSDGNKGWIRITSIEKI